MGSSQSKWTDDNIPDLSGKTVLITGGNTGLGFASAEHFLRHNADVILACRNAQKAADAKKKLDEQKLGGSVELASLDLADLDDAKASAEKLLKKLKKLDVLMLNAGVMVPPRDMKSKQGHELMFAVNHLGHYVFTLTLLPLLKKTADSRIVVVSSSAHAMSSGIDLDQVLKREHWVTDWRIYGDSKLANLLFARELQRRLDAQGAKQPMVVSAHPGWTATDLQRYSITDYMNWLFAMAPPQGSLNQVRAAVDPGAQKLNYYGPDGFGGSSGFPVVVEPTKYAKDDAAAKELWAFTEKLTGVKLQ